MAIWQALLLGFLEGLTEFLPVSSTGHLLLAGHFLGFDSPGKTFEVLIQLGAILAILVVYFQRLLQMVCALPSDPQIQRFAISLAIAFLPAALIGALLHDFIKDVLFETPMLVCAMLILGGFVLLAIDKMALNPRYHDVTSVPAERALGIGLFQCLALIPGVSRSGSTIVGGLLLGADKRTAAEFSFFLAMPTMAGAFALDLYKNWERLQAADALPIGVGFVAAFVTAVAVVKVALDFIGRHGFTPFAWWRIIVGTIGLAALAIYG
ncbi:undecaprenyl-diphosphate phosphatase [uncultured Hyphomicrobium sp.]|uniref:undecaprenyl-diphosphate phosphatase n=1 Tax=uncultured Hyphomicrobium sp. TaxID=194373 RepID=UPI0025DDC871|nr:undecaprenyl-diphosphate phosphatase [uncultured Hyphomicrobium sp.]